ncbi:MAG: hypothetical protein JOZ31_08520 [Verrucomicrobia bacterium]|nr:hypothetical protein [Verrucomicrobiota bacterium]MBV8482725.1 hypothetical protein [Verrucomicrobiota bacterium]
MPSPDERPVANPDAATVSAALEQLTGGWRSSPGVSPEALAAARHALAQTLLAGRSINEIRLVSARMKAAGPPADPKLSAELQTIATAAMAAAQPQTAAVIRSALGATPSNPAGLPEWTRSARVLQTYGPFQDLQGTLHWVDLIVLTVSLPFAFGSPASPFAVFPIREFLIPPPAPSNLSLGAGSVWFLADLLGSALPKGEFTGFTITGGTLSSSAPLSFQNGVYVVPAGETLTVSLTLSPAPSPVSSGGSGGDAAAAVFTPPANVTILFGQTDATFTAVAPASAQAYGSTIKLDWSGDPPFEATGLPLVIIPFFPSPANFAFQSVDSSEFVPSGAGPITVSGWALALANVSASNLPEASGPGTCLIQFGLGASIQTAVEPANVPIATGLIEIGTGSLFVFVSGQAKPAITAYQLWPQTAPSKLNASVDFSTAPVFVFAFLATPGRELLVSTGTVTAHLDVPLAATGARFPFEGGALLRMEQTATITLLFLIAGGSDMRKPIVPLALENALLGVDAPAAFVLSGVIRNLNLLECTSALFFDLRWLLPTLPDPYAANFDLTFIQREADQSTLGTLLALIAWAGGKTRPLLGFEILPPPQAAGNAGTPFPSSIAIRGDIVAATSVAAGANPALLDLSTRVDLFGVALAPELGRLAAPETSGQPGSADIAPTIALTGLWLSLNGSLVATFALPQVSWEPMESTAPDQTGPIFCEPASDGNPLLIAAPNNQQLVPFSPGPVLVQNIENVAAGLSFAASFSLPFGLNALIIQSNRPQNGKKSLFVTEGGQFQTNIPQFPESFVPNPSPAPPKLEGALQLTVMPEHPDRPDAAFPGFTDPDSTHGPVIGMAPNGYGYTVLGVAVGGQGGVGQIFENDFGRSGERKEPGVPVRRIDFSGYGASIYSDWNKPDQIPPAIIKVQFETTIGRTAYEVIKAASVIYPYCVRAVRTITMQRQNAGWIFRTDSGWQPASQGQFQFPPDPTADWTNRVHQGAFIGAFNVRNIRELPQFVTVPNPIPGNDAFRFQEVLFDADLGVAPSLKVLSGGFSAPVLGIVNPPVLVASKDIVGYLQLQPDGQTPDPNTMKALFDQVGPFTPAVGCAVEAGQSISLPGTTLRCSAFEVGMITETNTGAPVPALGVALRGAPQIPRGGGWSMGQRKFSDPAPSALPDDFPVPLVQPAGVTDFWFLSDVADILQLTQPETFYSLMHSTGTHKVLFESPQIPTTAAVPGLQFPKPNPPGPPKPGSAPTNPGSPNLGDIASILNSTGLFPDIATALSLIQGALEQINTITQGFHYSKTFNFDPNQQATLIDLGVIKIALQYADTTDPSLPPAALTYSVDSSASPSWSLTITNLSFLVTVPVFGPSPILTITGGFAADEHTKAGLTGLNVQMGDALSIVKDVFSDLQALAQFLPGGIGANLDVALSDGKLTVRDTFTIGDMPLGLGNLTDISLDLGLAVQFSPLSVDFLIGIGDPDNPFNWIVSPLAGNGLMDFGVQSNQPSLTIQAGIGLGLAIDLGIASGSASITIAVQLNVTGNTITLMAILTGQASVDVLDGLASASITLSAALGFSLNPITPPVHLLPPPVSIGPEIITMIASCSVGIHISICWVISIDFDGSWTFSQSITTPKLTVG